MSTMIVVAGQSNALGFGVTAAEWAVLGEQLDGRAKIWDWRAQAFVELEPGVNTGNNATQEYWGPEAEFARQWLDAHPGETLYIIKVADGQLGLAADPTQADWSPSSAGEFFDRALVRIGEARVALADEAPEIGALLWMQGEQDATSQAAANAYAANLETFVTAVRAEWGSPYTGFYLGRIAANLPAVFAYKDDVRNAQVHNDAADANLFLVDTDRFHLQVDGIHFSGEGEVSLGAGFFALYNGSETETGTGGADTYTGQGGADVLYGGDGDDLIAGGDAFDDLHGNTGNDSVHGANGDDWVVGGQGDDQLFGGAGDDWLSGAKHNDVLDGGTGADSCDGGEGDDIVRGGAGVDQLLGGQGADWLFGGGGADTLAGGQGADRLALRRDGDADLVTDFSYADGDRIELVAGAAYVTYQSGSDFVVDLGAGDKLVLQGIQGSALGAGWLVFV